MILLYFENQLQTLNRVVFAISKALFENIKIPSMVSPGGSFSIPYHCKGYEHSVKDHFAVFNILSDIFRKFYKNECPVSRLFFLCDYGDSQSHELGFTFIIPYSNDRQQECLSTLPQVSGDSHTRKLGGITAFYAVFNFRYVLLGEGNPLSWQLLAYFHVTVEKYILLQIHESRSLSG